MQPVSIVRDVVDRYLAFPRKGSPRAIADKLRCVRIFAADLGEKPIGEFCHYDFLLFVNAHKEWKSDWRKRVVLAYCKSVFSWAHRVGVIQRNPLAGLAFPRGERGRPMTEEEWAAILGAVLDDEFKSVCWFMRWTGCRTETIANLDWEHVDLARGCAALPGKTTSRTGKNIVVVLPAVAVELLRKLKATARPGQAAVFVNTRGSRWTRYAIASRMKALRKRLGLAKRCRMYGLRHRYGTEGVKRGLNPVILAELMNHADIRTTMHYVHTAGMIDHLRSSAEKLAE